jgi:STE24 endopeptidase
VGAVAAIGGAIDLPLSWYRQFSLEKRFGFNRMTPALFLTDLAKGTALALALGTPLLVAVLWLMERAGSLWWLWAWAVWVAFNLAVLVLYPTVIAPMFNAFVPLEPGPVRDRVERLLERCGFASKGLFVMDGSRRSAHGNAYFTGFGRSKRIVFFDTLLARLSADELEAVLAHELGHFRHRHILKRIVATCGCSAGCPASRGSTRDWASRRSRATRWAATRCCCSSSRCRCSPSCCSRWAAGCRGATSSRPMRSPRGSRAPRTCRVRWSSCTRTTRRR